MDLLNLLSDDLLELILFNLIDIKDKRNLCIINKVFYEKFKPKIQKYKLIVYLNEDYLNFYTTLNKNNYSSDIDFMNKLVIKSFMNIPTVKHSNICSMYDLRYIFELMFKGYGLETTDIKVYNIHFYIHFYKKIVDCISKDRMKTLSKLDKSPYLFSLKYSPNFKHVRNGGKWISLIP